MAGRSLSAMTSEVAQRRTSVSVFHRRDVEVGCFDVRDRQQRERRQLRQVDGLEIAAARATHFYTAILALLVRGGGDERLASLVAVDAPVLIQLPPAGAERAAQRAVSADDFRERRPRSARGAVTAIPFVQRGAQ